jgi:hypothetical protein
MVRVFGWFWIELAGFGMRSCDPWEVGWGAGALRAAAPANSWRGCEHAPPAQVVGEGEEGEVGGVAGEREGAQAGQAIGSLHGSEHPLDGAADQRQGVVALDLGRGEVAASRRRIRPSPRPCSAASARRPSLS